MLRYICLWLFFSVLFTGNSTAVKAQGIAPNIIDPDLANFITNLYVVKDIPYWDNGMVASLGEGEELAPMNLGWSDQQKFRRLQVNDTTRFPWVYVGSLKIDRTERSYGTCTGTLISRHVVVTAAHCLYTKKHGYHRKAEFTLGKNGDFDLGTYKSKQVIFINPIEGNLDNNFDIAFVVLETSPFSRAYWQGVQRVPISKVGAAHFEKDNLPLSILASGYPTNINHLFVSGSTEYRNSIAAKKENQFEHKAFSPRGTSGGPIFTYDPLYNQFAMIGIISSQRLWSDGNTWAVGIKFNEYTLSKINEVVLKYEMDGGR